MYIAITKENKKKLHVGPMNKNKWKTKTNEHKYLAQTEELLKKKNEKKQRNETNFSERL